MDFRHKRHFKAQPGEDGGKNRRHGKDGDDLVIKVPPGTIVREAESGKIMLDLTGENERKSIASGRTRRKGQSAFCDLNQTGSRYAEKGQEEKRILGYS